jgi:Putative metal-binding domain of cation transport ATPase
MFRRLTSLTRDLFQKLISHEERISCYHCGERSKKNLTVYVHFEHQTRPVCCYGCAAILKTIEELGMHDEYHASKIHISNSND